MLSNINTNAVKQSSKSSDSYDLVIIAPKEFSKLLSPLVKHKNNVGVKTILKTTDEIYRGYVGRDKPEQIKYFIKDALETWGIKYVLLVGGMKTGRQSWYVPVRYSNLDDRQDWDIRYISDLYYADIYKMDGDGKLVFDDWDSNGNNVFAEWNWDSSVKDVLDLYPDVCVGRLACRNLFEVRTVVKKIINYETRASSGSWFKNMIIAGGDTVPLDQDGVYEGEAITDLSSSYMRAINFNITRLWVSDGSLKKSRDLVTAIRKGAGFVHISGHGTPLVWSTHPVDNDTIWMDLLFTFQVRSIRNGEKLPIFIIGGCHNNMFDTSPFNILRDFSKEGLSYFKSSEDESGSFWKFEWIPECLGWRLVSCRNGGAIAAIGNTGLGFCYFGNYTLNGLAGWIEPKLFYEYSVNGVDILGELHTQVIRDYINEFDVHNDRSDCKTVQQWTLLGDPSLKIGGCTN
jgi:hypothetical protein